MLYRAVNSECFHSKTSESQKINATRLRVVCQMTTLCKKVRIQKFGTF